MQKRILGKTGLEVSILGFGGAEIGFEQCSAAEVEQLLGNALDAGLNVIDTAHCYLASEELIGRAVNHRRDEFYLFTKCGHGLDPTIPAWTAEEIEASIDQSLKRLKTDYLDLVQLHSCSRQILENTDVIEAMLKAKQSGKTRYIGYSGDSLDALYAVESGIFDTLQTSVNIFDQEALTLTLPAARERNIGVIAKRPIGNAVWRFRTKPENNYYHAYWERMHALDYDFMDKAAEMALRFTLTAPAVATAIVGTTKSSRWRENAALLEAGNLSASEFEKISSRWQQLASSDWIGQI